MSFNVRLRRPGIVWIVISLALCASACRAATEVEPTAAHPTAAAVPLTAPIMTAITPPTSTLPLEQAIAAATSILTTEEPYPYPGAAADITPEQPLEPEEEPPPTPASEQILETRSPEEISQAFITAPFRVIAVVRPVGGRYDFDFPYELQVVAERAPRICGPGDERCTDDANCGSIYTAPTCYFFLEPQYINGADPLSRYVGQWQGGLDGLLLDTLVLSSDGKLQFQSAGGDGPCSVQATWELDTATGVVRELSRTEQCGG